MRYSENGSAVSSRARLALIFDINLLHTGILWCIELRQRCIALCQNNVCSAGVVSRGPTYGDYGAL